MTNAVGIDELKEIVKKYKLNKEESLFDGKNDFIEDVEGYIKTIEKEAEQIKELAIAPEEAVMLEKFMLSSQLALFDGIYNHWRTVRMYRKIRQAQGKYRRALAIAMSNHRNQPNYRQSQFIHNQTNMLLFIGASIIFINITMRSWVVYNIYSFSIWDIITGLMVAFPILQMNWTKKERDEQEEKERARFEYVKKQNLLTRRKEHYQQLNNEIFIKIGKLKPISIAEKGYAGPTIWDELEIEYDVDSIMKSHYFTDVKTHLEKDDSEIISDFNDLREEISVFNTELDSLKKDVQNRVITHFSQIGDVQEHMDNSIGKIYLRGIASLIIGDMHSVIKNNNDITIESMGDEICSSSIVDNNPPPKNDSTDMIQLGKYIIARIDRNKIKELITKIDELRRDRPLLVRLFHINSKHLDIIERGELISKRFQEISYSIESNKYSTVRDCCPH